MKSRTKLKKEISELITGDNTDQIIERLGTYNEQIIINPLFSFLYNTDELIKCRSISSFGVVVNNMYKKNKEFARNTMRRLIWNLNDESGGIGWGSPESMGEILAVNRGLAREYYQILLSYIRQDGNFLEHELLQRGVLWGIARFSICHKDLKGNIDPYLRYYINNQDHELACLAILSLDDKKSPDVKERVDTLISLDYKLKIYRNWNFEYVSIQNIVDGSFSLI